MAAFRTPLLTAWMRATSMSNLCATPDEMHTLASPPIVSEHYAAQFDLCAASDGPGLTTASGTHGR